MIHVPICCVSNSKQTLTLYICGTKTLVTVCSSVGACAARGRMRLLAQTDFFSNRFITIIRHSVKAGCSSRKENGLLESKSITIFWWAMSAAAFNRRKEEEKEKGFVSSFKILSVCALFSCLLFYSFMFFFHVFLERG